MSGLARPPRPQSAAHRVAGCPPLRSLSKLSLSLWVRSRMSASAARMSAMRSASRRGLKVKRLRFRSVGECALGRNSTPPWSRHVPGSRGAPPNRPAALPARTGSAAPPCLRAHPGHCLGCPSPWRPTQRCARTARRDAPLDARSHRDDVVVPRGLAPDRWRAGTDRVDGGARALGRGRPASVTPRTCSHPRCSQSESRTQSGRRLSLSRVAADDDGHSLARGRGVRVVPHRQGRDLEPIGSKDARVARPE